MSIFTPARRVLYAPSEEAIQVPFVIDRHAGVLPSFATDFAHNANESEYPECWRGLVGFWPIFLGQTGGKIIDLSGYGNIGTFVNTPIWILGDSGSAIDFEAGDIDHIDCGYGPKIVSGLTIIAYINPESLTDYPSVCGRWEGDGPGHRAWKLVAALNGGNPYIDISGTGSNDIYRQGTSALTLGKWVTIAGTYDGASLHFYRDGVLDDGTLTGVVPASLYQTDQKLQIGETGAATSRPFDGKISWIIIYNRTLSAGEIAFLSSNPTALVQLRRRAVMVSVGEVVEPPTGITVLRRRIEAA